MRMTEEERELMRGLAEPLPAVFPATRRLVARLRDVLGRPRAGDTTPAYLVGAELAAAVVAEWEGK